MSKFVVSGARGFVARQLVKKLVTEGHEVVGLTRVSCADKVEFGSIEIAVGDYSNESLLAFSLKGAHTVFHLAARAHQNSAYPNDNLLFHEANVLPTEALARACIVAGVGRFVLLSSIGVLGNRTDLTPFSDSSIPDPVDPYAVSKLNAEQRVMEILSDTLCDYCILRPPLVYGPGSPGNFSSLVSLAAKGPLIPLINIRAARTFIYINHLLDALVVAATHPAVSRRTFVISDKTDTSVSEIVVTAASIFGREPWRNVAIPVGMFRILGKITGQYSRFDKLLSKLQVDSTGFHNATGWFPAMVTSEAIKQTIRDWPSSFNKRTY
jgi:nucleoside-diphosphate-sugar epimerase